MAAEETGAGRSRRLGEKLGALLGYSAVAVLYAASAYAIVDAVLAPTPVSESPGFVDVVLASHAVVAAIRLAVIFAAAFVVVSVVALIGHGQWLTRVGPVRVSERASDVDAENERLKESLGKARKTIADLKRDLAESRIRLDQTMRG